MSQTALLPHFSLNGFRWVQVPQVLFLLLCLWLAIDYGRMLRLRRKLPPGPLPLPIVGNALSLPRSKPWYRFGKWSKQYNNPLITVWFGNTPSVILNDAWTASDLFEKRANLYSSRPRFEVAGRVMGMESCNQTMLPYKDQWRMHRKLTVILPKSSTESSTLASGRKPFVHTETSRPTNLGSLLMTFFQILTTS